MSDLIQVHKDGAVLSIHPTTLASHEASGWSRVPTGEGDDFTAAGTDEIVSDRDRTTREILHLVETGLSSSGDEDLSRLLANLSAGTIVVFSEGADRVAELTVQLDHAGVRLTQLTDRELDLGRFILTTFDTDGFPEGEQITVTAARLLGEQRTEIADLVAKLKATEASLAAALQARHDDGASADHLETLLGSSLLPAHVDLGNGIVVQLGGLVCATQKASELSVEAWNDLAEPDREALLAGAVERFTADPAAARAEVAEPSFISGFTADPLDHDGDGKKGGSKKKTAPAADA